MLRAVCATGIGARPTHEDSYLLNGRVLADEIRQSMTERKFFQYQSVCYKKVNLIAVSDGMGGHNAGEIASSFCVEALAAFEAELQALNSLDEVISALQGEITQINRSICSSGNRDPRLHGMGATLVLFVSCESEFAILNIGDSRAYCLSELGLRQISRDHTEGQRLLDLGILTRREVEEFPARKHLNRYFGYPLAGYQLQSDVFRLPFSAGAILLCSDGISDVLSERRIYEYLNSGEDSWITAGRMVTEAVSSPNADNATAIIIEFGRR